MEKVRQRLRERRKAETQERVKGRKDRRREWKNFKKRRKRNREEQARAKAKDKSKKILRLFSRSLSGGAGVPAEPDSVPSCVTQDTQSPVPVTEGVRQRLCLRASPERQGGGRSGGMKGQLRRSTRCLQNKARYFVPESASLTAPENEGRLSPVGALRECFWEKFEFSVCFGAGPDIQRPPSPVRLCVCVWACVSVFTVNMSDTLSQDSTGPRGPTVPRDWILAQEGASLSRLSRLLVTLLDARDLLWPSQASAMSPEDRPLPCALRTALRT